ncbi:GCN5-related N-acetyltransferase [Tepidanaerobacter acetatoxydans Re1]|uniref:GCN5-related N-acetyltransferase n=1 Tax=Tepidanaerobacter acetatoxydans (strain DSM 21804 / JCM 16047 / Re1) TaxID=1209989 RepID=F4LUX0_TEPAE|nr:GNAT family N-acetyltransferase [Tepidanaerobacter acetatoxydans]AEE91496.1 GCN5-related N-acetyltransferase [Tepidanaerobacter acetatoxydans Re1]CCP26208.1 GCN5-related N-acetyltransferase [Tepidanaerobacter acetatoxydans Re1]
MILIRKALPDERDEIKRILLEFDIKASSSDITDGAKDAMIVELDDLIVGYGSLDIYGDIAILKLVCVLPKYQNQGFGDGLVRALINYADRRNVKKMYIVHKEKVEYFKRFGFKYVTLEELDNRIHKIHNHGKNKSDFIMELDVDDFFNKQQCHF